MKASYNIIIFIKNPIEGEVKTRLADSLGTKKALDIYKKLLKKTYNVTKKLPVNKTVYYDKYIDDNDMWNNGVFNKKIQVGNDLGERMKNAFENSVSAGYQKTVIIGSDCWDITDTTIERAFCQLDENDFVIGPSEDGGYYLLGMKMLHGFIFEEMPWSKENLLKLTISKINSFKLNYYLLPELNDIDTIDDLHKSSMRY